MQASKGKFSKAKVSTSLFYSKGGRERSDTKATGIIEATHLIDTTSGVVHENLIPPSFMALRIAQPGDVNDCSRASVPNRYGCEDVKTYGGPTKPSAHRRCHCAIPLISSSAEEAAQQPMNRHQIRRTSAIETTRTQATQSASLSTGTGGFVTNEIDVAMPSSDGVEGFHRAEVLEATSSTDRLLAGTRIGPLAFPGIVPVSGVAYACVGTCRSPRGGHEGHC